MLVTENDVEPATAVGLQRHAAVVHERCFGDRGVTKETPSPPSNGGEGRGEEVRCVWMPLSSVL